MMRNSPHTILLFSVLTAVSCTEEPEPAPGPRLHVFDCGRLKITDQNYIYGDAHTTPEDLELATPCYVVEHEKGRLLWDGGLWSSLAGGSQWQPVDYGADGLVLTPEPESQPVPVEVRLERSFAEQISELGWDMSSFDYTAFSHFHYDHCGVGNELENTTLLIDARELEFLRNDMMRPRDFRDAGYVSELYDGLIGNDDPIISLTEDDYTGLAGDYQHFEGGYPVFEDDTVVLIPTLGHTAGHLSLFVELTSGPILLTGDLYHTETAAEQQLISSFNESPEVIQASMDAFDELGAVTGATIWVQHSVELFDGLDHAPEHYYE